MPAREGRGLELELESITPSLGCSIGIEFLTAGCTAGKISLALQIQS